MGLDASVYCDCIERGHLRTPPRPEWDVHVGSHGGREARLTEPEQQLAFDNWDYAEACEHQGGILLHHRLGNISLIALFRQLLEPRADRVPVLWSKVIYSGTHCGDQLDRTDVDRLVGEIDVLAQVHDPGPENEKFLRAFEQQLRELTHCAMVLNKPIVF
jgi:hypothetical protein